MRPDVDVIVIGGGMAGLGAADLVQRQGGRVTVLEAGANLGGLAASTLVEGEPVESFYHHIFPQDRETIELIERLGLRDDLEWRTGSMAIVHRGVAYRFDRPLDLIRFTRISPLDRLRLGVAGALQVPRLRAGGIHHERVGVGGPRWFGRRGYEVVWRPLLEAKFGSDYENASMAWLAARIRQRAGARRLGGDRLGYLRGSLSRLTAALEADLRRREVAVETEAPVTSLRRDGEGWTIETARGTYRAVSVVAAVSGHILARMVELPSDYRRQVLGIRYRGVVCLLLEMEFAVSPFYWINVTDRLGLGCVGIIEHTNFIPSSRYGGRHLIYLAHYVGQDDEAWSAPADSLIAAVEPIFRVVNPRYRREWIRGVHIARAPFAQPIPIAGGPMTHLPIDTGLPGLHHVSLAHVYPDDRGVSNALRMGYRAGGLAWRHAKLVLTP